MAYHPKTDRAKLFAPFDALSGFREALREKERIIVPKIDLSEEISIGASVKINRHKAIPVRQSNNNRALRSPLEKYR